jgi:arsenate reductase
MKELGIDLAEKTPTRLTHELAQQADIVITMGCGDECPYIPGKQYIDGDLPDPANQPIDSVSIIRDEIAQRIRTLVAELDG